MRIKNGLPLYIGAEQVQKDLGVSRTKAYNIVRELNERMLKKYPETIVIPGKVNRHWYEEVFCLGGK